MTTGLLFLAFVVADIFFTLRLRARNKKTIAEIQDVNMNLSIRLAAMNRIALMMHDAMTPAQRLSVEFDAGPSAPLPWVQSA
jgi:hypothetical protein